MSSNGGAWGVAMWRDDSLTQADGISLEGGSPIVPYLPVDPIGCLTLPPEGLGVPDQRTGDVVFAQTDGVMQFEDFYSNRFITLRVTVCNDGCPGCPTGRAKVKRLLREWSRTCTGATLALFTDCHDPAATIEERVVTGPFLVRGRPRIADVTWLRSNFGCAQVLLRFDTQDHRLVILPPENDADTTWTGTLCMDVFSQADAEVFTNLATDPHARTLTWSQNGSVGVFTHPTTGGPHNQGYFQYAMTAQNTSDPMEIHTSGAGLSGIPVVAGQDYTVSSYWFKTDVTVNTQSYNVTWYDAGGAVLSSSAGADVGIAVASTWWRASRTVTAPVGAAFARFTLAWNGTYDDQPATLRVADILIEEGSTAHDPFFSGAWLGVWSGTAHASTSTTRVLRVNYAWNPRATLAAQWSASGTGGSAIGESPRTGQSDGPEIPGTQTDTYMRYTWITGGALGTSSARYDALQVPTEAFEIGDQVTVSVYVRSSAALTPTPYLSQQVNGADGADVVGVAAAALVPNTWTRVSQTLTLTAYADGINQAGVQFVGQTIADGTTVDIGYVLIEKVNALDDYFDGSMDLSDWQGTANNSVSVEGPGEAALAGDSVTIYGDLCSFPIFTLTGPMAGPVTIYYDGSPTLVYSGDVAAGADPVVIDTRYTRAFQGSEDVSANLSGTIAASLPLGTTVITVTAGPLSAGTVEMCWENAVISG